VIEIIEIQKTNEAIEIVWSIDSRHIKIENETALKLGHNNSKRQNSDKHRRISENNNQQRQA
jgi:hypothetical protein